jgi:signal transduction histidine kinase
VHQALDELRQVIGLLHEGDEAGAGGPVTVSDLHGLVDASRAAGQPVHVGYEISGEVLPPSVGRTVFRIVQEGLTNARKHAAGRRVDVSFSGAPGTDLVIELVNPLPAQGEAPTVPGSGLGLVGLTERVRLAGGQLDHGDSDGRFRLRARLPWPS